MSDKIPGSSYSNPIWYRDKWRIYADSDAPQSIAAFAYVHDDYDGPDAPDDRAGYAATVEGCKAEIDEQFYDGETQGGGDANSNG